MQWGQCRRVDRTLRIGPYKNHRAALWLWGLIDAPIMHNRRDGRRAAINRPGIVRLTAPGCGFLTNFIGVASSTRARGEMLPGEGDEIMSAAMGFVLLIAAHGQAIPCGPATAHASRVPG